MNIGGHVNAFNDIGEKRIPPKWRGSWNLWMCEEIFFSTLFLKVYCENCHLPSKRSHFLFFIKILLLKIIKFFIWIIFILFYFYNSSFPSPNIFCFFSDNFNSKLMKWKQQRHVYRSYEVLDPMQQPKYGISPLKKTRGFNPNIRHITATPKYVFEPQ